MTICAVRQILLFFWVALAILSCETVTQSVSRQPAPTYYEDVKPILDAKCVRCHAKGRIAPMPLTAYANAFPYRDAIAVQVADRTMPPWLAVPGHRKYKDDFSLGDTEIDTIVSWARGGGLAGTPKNMDSKPLPLDGLPRVDVQLSLLAPYTPLASPDDYRCFVLDLTHTTTKFVTGFNAKPGNESMVHHVVAYLAFPEGATNTAALDAGAAGDGYPCFGGPGRIGVNDYDYSSVGGWTPGAAAEVFPAGTGIRVPPGSKIVLQIHYNVGAPSADTDQTQIELMMADDVEKEGFFIPWLNVLWLASDGMRIPAGNANVTQGFEFDPTLFTFEHTPIEFARPFRIYSAQLHMHLLGKSGQLYIRRSSGPVEVLLEISKWNFHWQRHFDFVESVRFEPGDRLGIQCVWDNSAERQPLVNGKRSPPKSRSWGEGSDDEMCVGFFYTTRE